MALTRRAFLALVGLVFVPSPALAHHRTGHGRASAPVVSSAVYSDRYASAY